MKPISVYRWVDVGTASITLWQNKDYPWPNDILYSVKDKAFIITTKALKLGVTNIHAKQLINKCIKENLKEGDNKHIVIKKL